MFVTLYGDHNLLDSSPPTVLSTNQSVLLNSLIHRAHSVVSLRPLKTGTAKDVTGVMRITRGGAWYDFDRPQGFSENEEWEMLYRVEDGRTKLFKNA
jgi:elongator complex protein 6